MYMYMYVQDDYLHRNLYGKFAWTPEYFHGQLASYLQNPMLINI